MKTLEKDNDAAIRNVLTIITIVHAALMIAGGVGIVLYGFSLAEKNPAIPGLLAFFAIGFYLLTKTLNEIKQRVFSALAESDFASLENGSAK